ncbi:uncharacterized protein C8A04DRAFT_40107 [Dichotomopilus funicola]|uniref:Uncharacterized protein n=1 Tax=Dichotomopilus funicola TaxID=1934379 RepID=A0AAN6UVU2_9PEZI|nr:hypothetical protein C8A04DRAFT_40107 [Dichotomopilus funicola]
MSTCEPLQGNSDFYGLGIRLGIYLQWASAWVSLLLNPESAQGVLDANSVSLFAVVIATIVAARQNAPAIELYIMLQILVGFPVTTLSTFGIRIWLTNPARLEELLRKIVQAKQAIRQSAGEEVRQTHDELGPDAGEHSPAAADGVIPGQVSIFRTLPVFPFHTVRFLSPLKFPGLSWSGVTWRVITVAMVVGYSVAYWFDPNGHGAHEPPSPGCEQALVFMFSRQLLEGPIVTLGRMAAVLMAAIIVIPTVILIVLTIRLTEDTVLRLYRDLLFSLTSSAPQTFNDSLRRINRVLENKSLSLGIPRETMAAPLMTAKSLLDLMEFMSAPNGDKIRFSDVLKVAVSLGMGRPPKRDRQQDGSEHHPDLSRARRMLTGWNCETPKQRRLGRICIVWNVLNVLSIVWFITSIETTILWNNIQGVHTIDSTGQLIPFIIGVVSASQVLKRIALLALARKYPDWAETQLEIHEDGNTFAFFRLVKPPEAVQTRETQEGPIGEETKRSTTTV